MFWLAEKLVIWSAFENCPVRLVDLSSDGKV